MTKSKRKLLSFLEHLRAYLADEEPRTCCPSCGSSDLIPRGGIEPDLMCLRCRTIIPPAPQG